MTEAVALFQVLGSIYLSAFLQPDCANTSEILYTGRKHKMKANECKTTSDALECKNEIYLSVRNSIHSASKHGQDGRTFCYPFSD